MKALIAALFLAGILPAAAGLVFEAPAIKVDAAIDDKTVTRDFKFTNGGDKTVKIKEADAGCSCLAVEVAGGKFTYAPGESGVLRAVFELGSFQGVVDKRINIWLEGDPVEAPSASVSMSVHIPVIIKLEPKTLKWEVGSPADPRVIDVAMDYEKPIHVTSVSTSNANFSAKLVTVEDGKHYRVEVTPVNGTDESGICVVRIETDAEVEKHRIQQGFAVVSAPIGKTP